MKCEKCNIDNRKEAKYCKHCGHQLPEVFVDPFENIIGLSDVKETMTDLIERVRTMHKRGANVPVSCNFLIMGASGTGKSHLAHAIATVLHSIGLSKRAEPIVVDAVDWDNVLDNWGENVKQFADSTLIIDNVQKLLPDGESRDIDSLDPLFSAMERWQGNPSVILLGLPGGFREYIEANPSVRRKFQYFVKLDEYTAAELAAMCIDTLTKKFKARLDEDSYGKLERVFMHMVRNKPEGWGNAHEALKMAEKTYYNMLRRGGDSIKPDDIEGQEYHDKTPDEIMAELDEFVGIDNIRSEIRTLIQQLEFAKVRSGGQEKPSITNHYVFSGNPGTGKTTVARKMGNIFKALGVLPIGHLVEADRSKMVAQYVGHTAKMTNDLIDKAMGGVLLIDEAYTLNQGESDSFGHEAIDTLLKRLEDDRGKFVCIVAGYTKQMFDFIQSNPGLQSRFNKEMRFEDYDGAALTEIFRMMLKERGKNQAQPFILDSEAERYLRPFFNNMYNKRDKNFGNARDVRKVVDTAISRQSDRLSRLRAQGQLTPDMLYTLTRVDIEGEDAAKIVSEDDILVELDGLVGLTEVKEEIHKLAQVLKFQKMRAEALHQQLAPPKDHYLFLGNPGTGKTTVARIMARIFNSLGLTSSDKVIEVDRSKMVSKYVGQTSPMVNDVVDRSLGGLLFIDEAYTLIQGENDSFGREAVDTLLKRLEDDRGKFICIAAGYTREMSSFIDSNSGLQSRFTKTINFEDYDPDALADIFRRFATKENFSLTPEADDALLDIIDEIYRNRQSNFGNAREMRTLFEKAQAVLSDRVMSRFNQTGIMPTPEEFTTFQPEDFYSLPI